MHWPSSPSMPSIGAWKDSVRLIMLRSLSQISGSMASWDLFASSLREASKKLIMRFLSSCCVSGVAGRGGGGRERRGRYEKQIQCVGDLMQLPWRGGWRRETSHQTEVAYKQRRGTHAPLWRGFRRHRQRWRWILRIWLSGAPTSLSLSRHTSSQLGGRGWAVGTRSAYMTPSGAGRESR